MPDQTNQLVVPKVSAPTYTYTIPEGDRQYPTDPVTFSVRAWTLAQENDARRAQAADQGSQLELHILERALVKVDGKPVDQAEDTLGKWSPRCRMFGFLVVTKIQNPQGVDAFLASEVIETA